MGDFNADPCWKFGKELLRFASENDLICADIEFLASSTYTFIIQSHGLIYCIIYHCPKDKIANIEVDYCIDWTDHKSISVSLKTHRLTLRFNVLLTSRVILVQRLL